VGVLLGEPAHFIMQIRQFQNLGRRVRGHNDSGTPMPELGIAGS
jgi:hypothetical protein